VLKSRQISQLLAYLYSNRIPDRPCGTSRENYN